jgi:hypothetical protein
MFLPFSELRYWEDEQVMNESYQIRKIGSPPNLPVSKPPVMKSKKPNLASASTPETKIASFKTASVKNASFVVSRLVVNMRTKKYYSLIFVKHNWQKPPAGAAGRHNWQELLAGAAGRHNWHELLAGAAGRHNWQEPGQGPPAGTTLTGLLQGKPLPY